MVNDLMVLANPPVGCRVKSKHVLKDTLVRGVGRELSLTYSSKVHGEFAKTYRELTEDFLKIFQIFSCNVFLFDSHLKWYFVRFPKAI